jgi:hypothetical protein
MTNIGGENIGGSMTGTVCDVAQQAGSFPQVPDPPDLIIDLPAKDKPGLVGVYFGGRQYACGVLHPTGQCMMRNTWDDATTFCPVCRYILVEQINPEQHSQIDRDYDVNYHL